MKIKIESKLLDMLFPPKIEDLIEEVNDKNHVELAVYKTLTGPTGKRTNRFEHEQYGTKATPAMLWQADAMRMMKGLKSIYVEEAIRRSGGELVGSFPNLRTNIGYDWCAKQLSNAGTSAVTSFAAIYIALSNNTTAPVATSASSTVPWSSNQAADAAASGTTGEFTFGGMTRAAGTPAHAVTGPASATTSYTVSYTFTATGAVTAAQVAGLFGGSAANVRGVSDTTNMLFLSTAFTATTLANTDQLAITWTVNI